MSTSQGQQLFENSLYGVIDKSQLEKLRTRLSGLCGESNKSVINQEFTSWEVVFKTMSSPHLRTETETMKSKTRSTTKAAELNTLGISASHLQPVPEQVQIRVESDLKSTQKDSNNYDVREWKFVKNIGKDLPPSKDRVYKTATKPVNFSKIFSDNILEFLQAIEVNYEFEFIKKGFKYYTASQICISIYQVYTLATLHGWDAGMDQIKNVDPDNYMVEMSCISNFDSIKDVETEMLLLADNLSSIVSLTRDVQRK